MSVSTTSTTTIFLFLFVTFLLALIILDIAMIISLLKTGDERRQLIVWKASASTLLIMVIKLIFDIVESLIRSTPMMINPFVELSLTAVTYFIALLYFKKKYGD